MRNKLEILIKSALSLVLIQLFLTVLYAEGGIVPPSAVMTVLCEAALSCTAVLGCGAFSEYILKNVEN